MTSITIYYSMCFLFGFKYAPIFRHTDSSCPNHNDDNSDQEANFVDCKRYTEDQSCPWEHGDIGVHETSFSAYCLSGVSRGMDCGDHGQLQV